MGYLDNRTLFQVADNVNAGIIGRECCPLDQLSISPQTTQSGRFRDDDNNDKIKPLGMQMMKPLNLTLLILSVFLTSASPLSASLLKDWPVSYDYSCSEDITQKTSSCPDPQIDANAFIQATVSKKYTQGQVEENLKKTISLCSENIASHFQAYRLHPDERNRQLIKELRNEIVKLNGRAIENIVGGDIIRIDEDKWVVKDDELNFNNSISNDSLILKFKREIQSIKGASPPNLPKLVSEKNFKVRGKPFKPDRGIKVSDGWLLGSDQGEWGGDLIFVGDDWKPVVVINDNIIRVYQTSIRNVAVTGTAHLGINYGYIFAVEKIDGKWVAKEIANIYGYPFLTEQQVDGSLLLANDFGSFLLGKDGLCRLYDPRH